MFLVHGISHLVDDNGFGLAEGGDFVIRMLKFTIMLNRIPNVQPCNSAPLLANSCWWLGLF